ncbi:GMC family oxidoreductase N-terminal domain-containing protein [Chromobacterium haemolyticum]|nr:GMC family oxidoreductase N-terminal domain-containing protein [Chromobacterium haemolyticum]
MLPAFKKAESHMRLSEPYHGVDGPLKVSDTRYRHPLSLAFVQGAQEIGLAYNDDFNGREQAGVGFYHTTTFRRTARQHRRHLSGSGPATVRTGPAHRLLCAKNRVRRPPSLSGGMARRRRPPARARATAEIVLCAGALSSPKLLMLLRHRPRRAAARTRRRRAARRAGSGRQLPGPSGSVGLRPRPSAHQPVGPGPRPDRAAPRPAMAVVPHRFAELQRGGIRRFRRHRRRRPAGHSVSCAAHLGGRCGSRAAARPRHFHQPLPAAPQVARQRRAGRRRPGRAAARFDSGALREAEDIACLLRGVKLARRILRRRRCAG